MEKQVMKVNHRLCGENERNMEKKDYSEEIEVKKKWVWKNMLLVYEVLEILVVIGQWDICGSSILALWNKPRGKTKEDKSSQFLRENYHIPNEQQLEAKI